MPSSMSSISRKFKKWSLRLIFISLMVAITLLVTGLFAITLFTIPDKSRSEIIAKYADENSIFLPLRNGQTVHLKDEGPRNAQTLLLLHGANASLLAWDGWATELVQKYRIVRVDLPGHGMTGPAPDGQYSSTAMDLFISEIIDKLALENPILGGNGMGGRIALHYALTKRQSLGGLVLIGADGLKRDKNDTYPLLHRIYASPLLIKLTRYITPYGVIRNNILATYGTPIGVTDAMVAQHYDMLLHSGNRQATIDRLNSEAGQEPLDIYLGSIVTPTLLLWGEEDSFVPLKYGKRMHAYIFSSQMISYPGNGHVPMQTTPQLSALHVDQFIREEIAP